MRKLFLFAVVAFIMISCTSRHHRQPVTKPVVEKVLNNNDSLIDNISDLNKMKRPIEIMFVDRVGYVLCESTGNFYKVKHQSDVEYLVNSMFNNAEYEIK